jgi:hypothetical protein
MNYVKQQITSAGVTLNNATPFGQLYNVLAYTTAPVTLLGNVVINPTIVVGFPTSFDLRWEANLTLSTFSVVIVGITMAQDQVNQTGTFSCYYDGTAWSVQYFADGKDQPQAAQGVTDIPVPVGGTKTLEAGVDTSYQRLTGPTTLTSNYTVTAGTVGIKAGSQFQIEVAGGLTIGANAVTVFGININENQALNGGVIIFATFDGTNWVAASTSRPITTADIDPVTALSVMGNDTNTTAAPSNIQFSTDFGVLHRNGNSLTTALLTAASFDSTSIVANRVSVVTLTSAQILASNTPITIVPASGLNTINVISSITVTCTFDTTAYTGNTDVSVFFPSSSDKLFFGVDLWGYAASGVSQLNNFNVAAQAFQYATNEPLNLQTDTSNPTGGDGTAKITVIYQTITL